MSGAVTVSGVEVLHAFVRSVIIRSKHHAEELTQISLTLAGAILWKKDPDIEIRVRTNVLWVQMGGRRYAFAYVQGNGGKIEMRADSQQGPALHVFTNATTSAEVIRIFDAVNPDPDWETFTATR